MSNINNNNIIGANFQCLGSILPIYYKLFLVSDSKNIVCNIWAESTPDIENLLQYYYHYLYYLLLFYLLLFLKNTIL